jgi:phage terminase large subunit-like protein
MARPRKDEAPDPQKLIRLARQTLSAAEVRRKFRRMDFLDTTFWYSTQLEFFKAGASGVHQRLIYGGNQTGKTLSCAFEVACHLTGLYPSWWTGKRFNKPIRCWVVGESVTLVRDSLQRQLCGAIDFGTGTIPLHTFAKKPIMVPGGSNAIDTAFVTHETDGKVDGTSSVSFRSFEMRREKLQSETVDLIHVDERPDESIYSELLARTSATDGHLIVSYTPVGEGGAAGITYKFLSESSPDRAVFRIRSDEAKHISEERRAELAESYSDAERETRLEGTPQLGAGPVFPIELLPAITKHVDPNKLPFYNRWLVGIDFGYRGGFAAVLISWQPDTADVTVVDSFQMQQANALYHTQRIFSMCRNLRIPVAYPHDAGVHDKGSGVTLAAQYKAHGLNMLPRHATNHGTTNFTVEPGISEMKELMTLGKLTIGSHNTELLEQLRLYHRDENFKIVKERDHMVDALRYAIMMKRSGKVLDECEGVGGTVPLYGAQRRAASGRTQIAGGMDDWDIFTGR